MNKITSKTKIVLLITTLLTVFSFISIASIVFLYHESWLLNARDNLDHELEEMIHGGAAKIEEEIREYSRPGATGHLFWSQNGKVIVRLGAFTKMAKPASDIIEIYAADGSESYVMTDITFSKHGLIGYGVDVTDSIQRERYLITVGSILFLIMVLIAGFASYWGGSLILRPLEGITWRSSKWDIDNLEPRLQVPDSPKNDVIYRLATNLNRMLDALQLGAERIRSFNRDIAHELRNALSVISSDLQLAIKKEDWQGVKSAEKETEKMIDLTHKMLFVSQGNINLITEMINAPRLQKMIGSALRKSESLHSQKKIESQVKVDEDALIQADETLLSDLIANLCENAYKHNIMAGHVYVHISNKELLVQNSTVNTLSKKDVAKIFSPFARMSHEQPGHGLGLSIVQKIADLHGWKIKTEPGDHSLSIKVSFTGK